MKYHRERCHAPPLDPTRIRAVIAETALSERQPVFTLMDQAMRQSVEAGTEIKTAINQHQPVFTVHRMYCCA